MAPNRYSGHQPLSGDRFLRRAGDPALSNRPSPTIVYVQRSRSLADALIVEKPSHPYKLKTNPLAQLPL